MELHYDNFVKIIPIGRTSVGKSSLLNMYIDERMDHPYRQNFHDFVVKPVKVDGNKCDLESKRAVESSTGKEFADSLNIPFIETSAKENINVEQAFVLLAAMIVKKLPETDTSRTKSSRK
ncbi:hypothetical protein LOD99_1703 [Oopsacas minuta]|uniref:Uncharacterized protein n=1 Tax=Oopsacas minuta TaxID=111878 RepID=A0AAV7K688_9METZ|nr:hypothetical protein LOD99_1703 [Oopsacas minuta]